MKSRKKKKLASNSEYEQRQFYPEQFEKRFDEWVKNTGADSDYMVTGTKSYEEFRDELTKPKEKQ